MTRSNVLAVRAAAVVSSVLGATAARADIITFDLDGPGALNAPLAVGALDMAPGNTLLAFFAANTYTFSHQASLVGLIDANGVPIASPGLNDSFEVTIVSHVQYTQTQISQTQNEVRPSTVQPANAFIEIWFDTTPDANPLAGTGYNDGTRIYLGSPTAALPGLAVQTYDSGPNVPYDQFGVDNYPGQDTANGTGAYYFGSTTNLQDPGFFLTPVSSVDLSTSLDTPFDMTNPSANYVAAPGGAAPVPGAFVIGLPFQADGALQFTAVPEPAGLGAVALAGLALLHRRRRGRRATSH
jgi:hypothetical protein